MIFTQNIAVGIALLTVNTVAMPATSPDLEKRDIIPMADTINSYINGLVQVGFVPNVKNPSHKRDSLNLDVSQAKRATAPYLNLVISLLEGHGFEPATGTHKARNLESPSFTKRAIALVAKSAITVLPERAVATLMRRALANLDKRGATIPDIGLVISCLEAQGFYPSASVKVTRSLGDDHETIEERSPVEKRQTSGDINSVIVSLINYGYNPGDFGPTASKLVSSFMAKLPTTSNAVCPGSNNTLYNSGGRTYQIQCGYGYNGYDLSSLQSWNLAQCLSACANWVPRANVANGAKCVAATWLLAGDPNTNCHLKYAVASVSQGTGMSDGRHCGRIVATT